MVSLDDPDKNRKFAESEKASFVLLSDSSKESAERYGVLGFASLYTKRWTHYIDASGIIRRIDTDVSPESHGRDVVRALGELAFPKLNPPSQR